MTMCGRNERHDVASFPVIYDFKSEVHIDAKFWAFVGNLLTSCLF